MQNGRWFYRKKTKTFSPLINGTEYLFSRITKLLIFCEVVKKVFPIYLATEWENEVKSVVTQAECERLVNFTIELLAKAAKKFIILRRECFAHYISPLSLGGGFTVVSALCVIPRGNSAEHRKSNPHNIIWEEKERNKHSKKAHTYGPRNRREAALAGA